MEDKVSLKAAVQQFWNNKPCGTKNTAAEPGTHAFYKEIETHRYQEEFHIPLVAEFNDHRDERVLEVGCGLGTDAENLVFLDASFDFVYSHRVLHHSPDTEGTIREIYRVLCPDGKAIVMLYARESFGYIIGAQTVGRLRLEWTRSRMGREAFNRFVGLPSGHRGWLPNWILINNVTDGLGNPLSKLYTRN